MENSEAIKTLEQLSTDLVAVMLGLKDDHRIKEITEKQIEALKHAIDAIEILEKYYKNLTKYTECWKDNTAVNIDNSVIEAETFAGRDELLCVDGRVSTLESRVYGDFRDIELRIDDLGQRSDVLESAVEHLRASLERYANEQIEIELRG